MAVPQREQRILLQRSGNRCAFPTCRRLLTANSTPPDRPGAVILGEIAHIVGESPDGPRGDSPLTHEQRNSYPNLILLCNIHHQLIDDQPQTYTIERLHQMKQDHEVWVEQRLGQGIDDTSDVTPLPPTQETLYSTLLPVERMPRYIYGGSCTLVTDQDVKAQMGKLRDGEMAPFVLHGGLLYAFQDLSDPTNPFANVVQPGLHRRDHIQRWWDDPDRIQLFVRLANRAFNKLTGRRGLLLDREHRRYYFVAPAPGQERKMGYKPLNQKRTSRKVVWQPKNKQTGEGRGYWYNRAVALRLLQIGRSEWCLSIRPELHVTIDGVHPFPSEKVGSRVTRKKSRMFNYGLLGEIQFWRDVLSESKARIILPFGSAQQQLAISTTMLSGTISWPGMPAEHAKPFTNVVYVDDAQAWGEASEEDDAVDDDDEVDDMLDDAESVLDGEDVEDQVEDKETDDDDDLFPNE